MEVPRHWRLKKERYQGPGHLNQEGQIVVNGKIFDPTTGQTLSPIEIARQRLKESSNNYPYVLIAAMAELVRE